MKIQTSTFMRLTDSLTSKSEHLYSFIVHAKYLLARLPDAVDRMLSNRPMMDVVKSLILLDRLYFQIEYIAKVLKVVTGEEGKAVHMAKVVPD